MPDGKCPKCGKEIWVNNFFYPFCSPSCRQEDFTRGMRSMFPNIDKAKIIKGKECPFCSTGAAWNKTLEKFENCPYCKGTRIIEG